MAEGKIILGLPSKGRILEGTKELFDRAGLMVEGAGGRDYTGSIKEFPKVEVRFMPALEVAKKFGAKEIDAGITGLDLLQEAGQGRTREYYQYPLGFSRADVVLASPALAMQTDDPILKKMQQAEDMRALKAVGQEIYNETHKPVRVATKYPNLTERFFNLHNFQNYQIQPSTGATEGAVANGVADMIADITSTGKTLRENQLQVLSDGVILRSEAKLFLTSESDIIGARILFPWLADLANRLRIATLP